MRGGKGLTRAVLAIYIACFSIGAFNHARDFAAFGWRRYQGVALPIEAFWSALILLRHFSWGSSSDRSGLFGDGEGQASGSGIRPLARTTYPPLIPTPFARTR
ncbi:hypothetical protein FHS96_000360 [Sphingomonas zeicaulis]|uniref:hypothetical protein n=1 Tax=Sphingomonas zeicaulis TaxID=1632740 RepID=UPI003D235846